MAAAAAAAGAGEPLSPDELLPKGDAEKTEEELEEDDDEEVPGPCGVRAEERAVRGCGVRVLRDPGAGGFSGEAGLGAPALPASVSQRSRRFSRAALWIGTTSFMILVLPVVFETEKLQMEQQQQLQQRQILLGPNTGLSGGMPGALPSLPGKI
ncbi:Mitochondrial import receptor subunit TOM22-like protein [Sciurus carolinensis]|uniref:Mitochondrial import receptor subunit TOM22 homolog n=1 Tax=Sciurus carolinensis TaxID=30640 RepID=A0AA41MIG8_SCICA|nr:Mitochondrial import receptor subunit TOM22-like protein [Sciurus carolinensis]